MNTEKLLGDGNQKQAETLEEFIDYKNLLIWWTSRHDCKVLKKISFGNLESVIPSGYISAFKERLKHKAKIDFFTDIYGSEARDLEVPIELFKDTTLGRIIANQNMVGIEINRCNLEQFKPLGCLITDFKLNEID